MKESSNQRVFVQWSEWVSFSLWIINSKIFHHKTLKIDFWIPTIFSKIQMCVKSKRLVPKLFSYFALYQTWIIVEQNHCFQMPPVSTGDTVVESGLAVCSLTGVMEVDMLSLVDMLSFVDMDMLFFIDMDMLSLIDMDMLSLGTLLKGKSVRSSAALLALSLTWQPLLTCHCSSCWRW